MVIIACDDVPEGIEIDGHALQALRGYQGCRLDQHSVQRLGVLDDRRKVGLVAAPVRRRSHQGAVQIEDRPGLLAGNRRRLGIEGCGVSHRDGLAFLLQGRHLWCGRLVLLELCADLVSAT